MHLYIEIRDGELWSSSEIDGEVKLHGPGLEGAKLAYAAIMAAQLREGASANARASALLNSRIFNNALSKSEKQLKLHLSGKLKVEMTADLKAFLRVLQHDGSELYAGSDFVHAIRSLSPPALKPQL